MTCVQAADALFCYSDWGLQKMNYKQKKVHLNANGELKSIRFFRVYSKKAGRFLHQGVGDQPVRKVFKYWNQRLGLNLTADTANMARKTFCTIGANYFHFPDEQLMKISHHKDRKQFQTYVLNGRWEDLEQEAHVGRTFNLWGAGCYAPPVMMCMPDVLSRFARQIKTAMRRNE